MKLFSVSFSGHYLGGYGFVIAKNQLRAFELTEHELNEQGLIGGLDLEDVVEVDLTKEKSFILFNGDY